MTVEVQAHHQAHHRFYTRYIITDQAVIHIDNSSIYSYGRWSSDDWVQLGRNSIAINYGTIRGIYSAPRLGYHNTVINHGIINIISLKDYNTVTNHGRITTKGSGADGIRVRDRNTVTNNGSINTNYADGIRVGYGNTVTNSGSITTNYADGIQAGDNNTVTNRGSISTEKGGFADGIQVRNRNKIVNSGRITTKGSSADGIQVGNGNTVTNSGRITTKGSGANGIWVGNGNSVTNSGHITTTRTHAEGIWAGDNNTITNSGRITTKGSSGRADTSAGAYGIHVGSSNTITNSGAINTTGTGAYGIGALFSNTITNSGVINTKGDYADGMSTAGYSTIINSGAINTTGESAAGISATYNNKITNRGRITTAGDADSNGDGGHGIQAQTHNTIHNERGARIHTRGANAAGIRAGVLRSLDRGHNTIRNDGHIQTTGANAAGIQVTGKDNDVTNTGIISTTGQGAAGLLAGHGSKQSVVEAEVEAEAETEVEAETGDAPVRRKLTSQIQADNTRLLNSGSINTEGDKAPGIWVPDNSNVTNSGFGRINTEGEGAHGIQARDNNTVINRGHINTKASFAAGIWARDNNHVTNSGSIVTEGRNANGIYARHNNRVTNSNDGRIHTRGADAAGILAGKRSSLSRNYIVNNGFIHTTGPNAAGIQVVGRGGNVVTNTGHIHTTGRGAAGLLAGAGYTPLPVFTPDIKISKALGRVLKQLEILHYVADARAALREYALRADSTWFLNNGLITTTGPNAPGIQVSNKITVVHDSGGRIYVAGPGSDGIQAGDENLLILHGSISSAQGSALILGHNNNVYHSGRDTLRSTGQDTPAVMMGDGNTLINTGTIEATGTGANAHAITGGSNNTLHNSGTISAQGGKAANLSGRGNTLNLLPGAALIGDINLGPGGRVAVDTAPVNSVFWHGITARPKKRSEGAPFFYNARTRQLATYDIRALAASAQVLGDASGNVSGLMARPGLESSGNTRSLIPTATGSALWLRAFGNRARYRSRGRGDLNPEAGHLGLAAGYDLRLNATQFGVLAGYGRGELRFEGTQRFRPGPSLFKGPFAGVYVRRDFAPFSVQVGLAGGTLRHESSRLVNDNRAPNGQARASARTRSWWLAPEARVGLRLDTGLMHFEPAFTARYAWQSIRGFTETGIRAPATVGQRKVELMETRLELKTGREVGPGRIALKTGWQYRDDLNSNQAQVRMLGESQRVRLESGLGSSLYLGAEAEFELAPGLFLNLSGEVVSGSGYRNMSGMASVYQTF